MAEQWAWRFLVQDLATPTGEIQQYSPRAEAQHGTPPQLSESVGLMMDYALDSHDAPLFAQQVELLQRQFIHHDAILWKIPAAPGATVNSTIDDLRILSALLVGARQFHIPADRILAQSLANGLWQHNAVGGWLLDDAPGQPMTIPTPSSIAVRYWNITALYRLATLDSRFQPIWRQARTMLARSANAEGLYAISYDPATHTFQDGGTQSFNMDDELITALHAQAAGLPTQTFGLHLSLLWHQTGIIPLSVSSTWQPRSTAQSVATYALASRYFWKSGDRADALWILHRMLQLQVRTPLHVHSHNLQGAFSVDPSSRVYAFDQLEALLTLREEAALIP